MKEKFGGRVEAPMKTKEIPKHGELFLDESLYELQVEKIRDEGAKRERKGVITAINRFMKTPAGEKIGFAIFGAGLWTGVVAGGTVAHQEYNRRVSPDIYQVEDTPPSRDSFAGDRPLDEVRGELTEWLGEQAVRDLVPVTSSDRDHRSRERRREEIRSEVVAEVDGFDSVGISDESVERYLEQGFPRFMTARGNVASIEFTTEHHPMREDYHLGTGAEAAGTCSVAEADLASTIRLYGALLDSDGHLEIEQTFRDVLTHELAHAIDWENLEAVDPATRTRMLHQMVSHVRSEESRLRFSYIERISSEDAQEQLRNRTVEYYAEFTANVFRSAPPTSMDDPFWAHDTARSLVRAYGNSDMKGQEEYVRHVEDDVNLVRAVVLAYDPDFDWSEAHAARTSLLTSMGREREVSEYRSMLEEIRSPEARALVQEYLDIFSEGSESSSTRFIRLAGTSYSDVAEIRDMRVWDTEVIGEGRGLEIEVSRAQRTAIEALERDVLPGDLPAYQALRTLLETLADTQNNIEAMEDFRYWVRTYGEAAGNAGSGHVEAARRYMDILEGRHGLDRELLAQINRYVENYLSDRG